MIQFLKIMVCLPPELVTEVKAFDYKINEETDNRTRGGKGNLSRGVRTLCRYALDCWAKEDIAENPENSITA